MWVSQTYLGQLRPESDVYLYYFFEDYAGQKAVPQSIFNLLSELGYKFRDTVSAFMPMNEYLENINQELKHKFKEFWPTFQGKTPGIFLSRVPLCDFNPTDGDWIYFHITKNIITNHEEAASFFREMHRICDEIIAHNYADNAPKKSLSIFQTLYDSAELKVTFMGAGINIKPILSRLAQKRQRP